MTDAQGTAPRMLDLAPAARRVAALADAVTPGRLGDPTPCPQYAVRNLLGHITGLSRALRDTARKDLGPSTATNPAAAVPDIDASDGEAWRAELRTALDELVEAWRDPAAWQGMSQAGGVSLPGAVGGVVALEELTVHGWDLARALDLPYDPDPADLEAVRDFLAASADDRPEGGAFGTVVPLPADAPLLAQVVALSGRNPAWPA